MDDLCGMEAQVRNQWMTGMNQPGVVPDIQPQGLMAATNPNTDLNRPPVIAQTPMILSNSPSVQSRPYMPTTVTRTILQPYMANINSTGTSGFRSPSLSLYSMPQLNYIQTLSPHRATFPSCKSSNGYQFPSPIRTAASSSWASLPSTSLAVWSQMTTGPGPVGSLSSPEVKDSGSSTRTTCKRKVQTEEGETSRPNKVFIDEERMSTHLQGLNLDNNNLSWHPDLEEDPWYSQSNNNNMPDANEYVDEQNMDSVMDNKMGSLSDTDDEDEVMHKDQTSTFPRIELLDDLKLSLNTTEILPKVILEEINKPAMQVVLWKPPENLIPHMIPIKTDFTATSSGQSADTKRDSPFIFGNSPISNLTSIPLAPPSTKENVEFIDSMDDDMDL